MGCESEWESESELEWEWESESESNSQSRVLGAGSLISLRRWSISGNQRLARRLLRIFDRVVSSTWSSRPCWTLFKVPNTVVCLSVWILRCSVCSLMSFWVFASLSANPLFIECLSSWSVSNVHNVASVLYLFAITYGNFIVIIWFKASWSSLIDIYSVSISFRLRRARKAARRGLIIFPEPRTYPDPLGACQPSIQTSPSIWISDRLLLAGQASTGGRPLKCWQIEHCSLVACFVPYSIRRYFEFLERRYTLTILSLRQIKQLRSKPPTTRRGDPATGKGTWIVITS